MDIVKKVTTLEQHHLGNLTLKDSDILEDKIAFSIMTQ